jgi:hypothetical protein
VVLLVLVLLLVLLRRRHLMAWRRMAPSRLLASRWPLSS